MLTDVMMTMAWLSRFLLTQTDYRVSVLLVMYLFIFFLLEACVFNFRVGFFVDIIILYYDRDLNGSCVSWLSLI